MQIRADPRAVSSHMIVVIDYRAGNLYNVGNALRHLGCDWIQSKDPGVVGRASKVILPGVGSAAAAMESLQEEGLVEVLRATKAPFLGICLGLQLLFERSEEENTECLGILAGSVRRFDSTRMKVPHIGWNQVRGTGDALMAGIPDGSSFYFVHSYCAQASAPTTIARTEYGVEFASVVRHQNFRGVQFHPERSGEVGLRLLENFVSDKG